MSSSDEQNVVQTGTPNGEQNAVPAGTPNGEQKPISIFFHEILGLEKKNTNGGIWYITLGGIAVIIVAIIAILIFCRQAHLYAYISSLLIIITHIIVINNTIQYLKTSSKIIVLFSSDSSQQTQQMETNNMLFFGFYVLSLFLSGIIIYIFLIGLANALDTDWQHLYLINEILSLLIFLIFLVVDYWLFQSIKLVEKNGKNLSQHKDFIKKQISYIGFPGFVGILIILLITLTYDLSGIFNSKISLLINGNFIRP